MAPKPGARIKSNQPNNKISEILGYVKKFLTIKYAKSLLFDTANLPIVSIFILFVELILNIYIVQNVKYTEIDWIAYMQECEGFLNGTLDYSLLKGDTGPLVYPAGFVYIYSALYFITWGGTAIRLAQYIFVAIYLLQMALVLRLYCKTRKVPPLVVAISTLTSYRVHSIYMLRMFNDPIAILLFYIALNFYMDSRWTLASVFLSLAVSVKMNVLLFAPAIFLLYIVNLGYLKTGIQLAICAIIQIVLGLPFLITNAKAYLTGSFDFGRVFEHKWTVNYRFLPLDIFESQYFHYGLLVLHLLALFVFAPLFYKYLQNYTRLRALQQQFQPQIEAKNRDMRKAHKIKAEVRKRNKAKAKATATAEEPLTAEQEQFLNSFEKGLKQNSDGKKAPIVEKDDGSYKDYFIHFDTCTQLALLPIFVSNLVGIAFSRSLHYQFYVWYFHSLPHLVWSSGYTSVIKFLILALLEFCWNSYPSTEISSLILHACHAVLLYGIYRNMRLVCKAQ